jgi:hypothetical protein
VTDTTLDRARAVADAVLYEGYLLYPYRASSAKNQVRWQFGVLGPPGAAAAGVGEEPDLGVRCLVLPPAGGGTVRVHLRFLQLQQRAVERRDGPDTYTPVPELTVAGRTYLRWDEAVERELTLGPYDLAAGTVREDPVEVAGGADVEPLGGLAGRLVRRREPLTALVSLAVDAAGAVAPDGRPLMYLAIGVRNTTTVEALDRDGATARSFLGAHMILVADGASFVSVIDPPPWAQEAAEAAEQRRCWPVLAGGGTDIVLASPIILYDQPELAPESAGALFDSTEIDEILTLRVMTLTDEEKAAARATDPHAAAIIDRCESLTPADLQRLHGILRDPRAGTGAFAPHATTAPWWDPAADASVDPANDAIVVDGVEVRRGSLVRLRPTRRADAQDMFVAGQVARVTAVVSDVDGGSHVAVVLADDPGADLHEWYGRYMYFAPDELEPMRGR